MPARPFLILCFILSSTIELRIPKSPEEQSITEAKWGTVFFNKTTDNHPEQDSDGKRFLLSRKSRGVHKYYQKLGKDKEIQKEVEELGRQHDVDGKTEEELLQDKEIVEAVERRADTDNTVNSTKRRRFSMEPKCWKKCELSIDSAARLSLAVNFLLFFIKLAASIQAGSLSVISSLIDSGLDLFSGAAIAIASHLMHHYNHYNYPVGRNRLEPVAIIITAAVMGTASLQIITTAIENIISDSVDPNINAFSGSIIALTILFKGVLFLMCFRVDNASVKALATDHRNDIASNLAALIFGLLGTYVWKYIDPIGAILIAFYIIINWVIVGREQLKNLVGFRANRSFISKLTYIAMQHSDEIMNIDTVRAYTFGVNYLVELHIVLNPYMTLERAHNIGESLQLKLESIKEVERAFVHLDFETEHSPSSEHIMSLPND